MKLRMFLVVTATLCFVSCCNSDAPQSPSSGAPDGAAGQAVETPYQYTLDSVSGLDYSSDSVEHYDSDGRVQVDTTSAWSDDGVLIVRATFSPEAGYHLYSKSLPREGIDGLGRPTLVEVQQSGEIASVGELIADEDASPFSSDPRFPVYPDGPVTLYLPIYFRSRPQAESTIGLKLTYMACSAETCYRPIEEFPIEIQVPAPPGV